MTQFDNLRNSYLGAIQCALTTNTAYSDVKNANEILHSFCALFVENSNACDSDKAQMKNDLKLMKSALDYQIDQHFGITA